jgi:type II secretory pathway component PulC
VLAFELCLEQLGHAADGKSVEDLIPPHRLGHGDLHGDLTIHPTALIPRLECQFDSKGRNALAALSRRHRSPTPLRELAPSRPRGMRLDESGCETTMIRTALHDLFVAFTRRAWVLAVVTIVVSAAFAARAVASLVEASYLTEPPSGGPPLTPPPVKKQASARTPPDASALVDRNMFCSTCTRVFTGSTGGIFSGGKAVLIATAIGTNDSTRATVRVIGSDVQGSWGIGETIPGVGTIADIGYVSIDVVDANGVHAKLSLKDLTVGDGGGPTDSAKSTAAADPYADRIKKIDDHTYEVDRTLVRELVESVSRPQPGMRAIPVADKDHMAIRITLARPGTPAAAIGLHAGDTISSINNDAIRSAQQMLDLYTKLDTLNVVQLQGTRAGKPLELTLRLR